MYEDLIRELSCCPDAEYGCSRCKHHNTSLHCREDLMREAADAIKKLQEKVADKPKWISVEERFPPIDKEVLVFAVGLPEWGFEGKTTTAIAYRFMYRFWNGGKEYEQWSTPWEHFHKDYKITHWMPLPEPPKEGGGEE